MIDRQRIDIPIPKGRTTGKQIRDDRSEATLKAGKADSIRYQGLRIIPCDSVSYSVSSLGPLWCSLSLSALRKTVISGCFIHGSTLRVLYCILSLTLSSQAGNVSSCIILKIMSVFWTIHGSPNNQTERYSIYHSWLLTSIFLGALRVDWIHNSHNQSH